jgi:putative nucleotidyltransferase with HDIG domain
LPEASQNLTRLFGVMRTLVDLGPAATAERDFHETASDVLAKSMLALEAVQGALLTFDPSGTRMTSVASVKMEALGPEVSIVIARQQSQRWSQTRQPVIVKANEIEEYFGAQHMAGLQSLRMFAPLRAGSGVVGALLLGERLNQARYSEFESEAVGLLSSHLALLLQNHALVTSLKHQIADNLRLLTSLDHSFDDALEAFATTIDAKDKHMRGHSMRVGRYAAGIASSLGMSTSDVSSVRACGQLHDIGRVTVDKGVVAKTTALKPEEFREIADHTVMGHQIVSSVRFPWPNVAESVRWHHERMDGSGYPDHLGGTDLSLPVRIIAVADAFDAMTHERPYRRGLTVTEAAEELVRSAPKKFDGDVVHGLLAQLRSAAEGNTNAANLFSTVQGTMTPAEVDRFAMTLVSKLTNARVYSA